MKRALRAVIALGAVGLALAPGAARAHSAGLSRGEYRFDDEGTLSARLVFARGEVSDLVPNLDGNLDGVVTPDELAAARPAMRAAFLGGMKASAGGAPCAGSLDDARLVEGDGLEVSLTFRCPVAPAAELTLDFLDTLRLGHRHLVILPDAPGNGAPFAYREQKQVEVPAVARPRSLALRPWIGVAREGARSSAVMLLLLGVLVLAGGPRRDLARTAGAFVAAMFVAARLSVAGVAPVPRLVAPAMGLALLYAGLENFVASGGPDPVSHDAMRGRWAVAAALGAVAGFQLAGALRDVAMPVGERALAGTPFAAGGACAAMLLGLGAVLALPALASHVRWSFAAPAAGFAALAAGAWWLVRIWA